MKYCANCGTQMDDAARFCPSCGTASAAPQQPAQQPAQSPANLAAIMVPTTNLKEHFNRRINMLGGNKWKFVAVLSMLFLEFIIASFFDCLKASISMFGHTESASTTLWHEEFGFLGFLVAVILLASIVVAALPLFTKIAYQPWNLYAAAGANGLLLLITLWMYLDFSSDGADFSGVSIGFTFFGIVMLIFAVAGIALSYLMLKPWKELKD